MKNWKGPAKVLCKEGNFILIRHGSLFYRCHHADLMKVESDKKIEIDFSDKSKPVNVNKQSLKIPQLLKMKKITRMMKM